MGTGYPLTESPVMDNLPAIAAAVGTLLAALFGGSWYGRKAVLRKQHAEADKATAEADGLVQAVYSRVFTDLRGEMARVREEAATDRELHRQEMRQVNARVSKLEERERHMLTRVSVHEAWDRLMLTEVLRHNPDWSERTPPPLSWFDLDDDGDGPQN